jgi:hypothetical protein
MPQKVTTTQKLMQRPLLLALISLASWVCGFLSAGLCVWLGSPRSVSMVVWCGFFVIAMSAAVFAAIAAGAGKLWQVHVTWFGFLLVGGLLTKLLMKMVGGIAHGP